MSMFFFSSRRRHTRSKRDWSSDVCSSDLHLARGGGLHGGGSNWAIHEGSGSSSTGREARRAWTSRAPTRRHAARSAAIRSEERRVGKEGGERRAVRAV